MEKWVPWVSLGAVLAGWIWHAAVMSERLRSTRSRVSKLEAEWAALRDVRTMIEAGISGRRRYRTRAGTTDDNGPPAVQAVDRRAPPA